VFTCPNKSCYLYRKGLLNKVYVWYNASSLRLEDSKKLGKGEEFKLRMSKFVVNWNRLEIKSVLKKITLRKPPPGPTPKINFSKICGREPSPKINLI